jgi:hypothetical protein
VVQRGGGRDRLAVGAAEGRPRREVAGEQVVLAQLADDARVPARQRAARGLDVAEPRARARLREGPRQRRGVASASPSSTGLTACCRLV